MRLFKRYDRCGPLIFIIFLSDTHYINPAVCFVLLRLYVVTPLHITYLPFLMCASKKDKFLLVR